jgi:UDP-3-O-[3-hydroxymyristoyl] N-acetylglucosamine deacetylase/3-hydroxyacyl-[acyl-carrier-protein] dehydratase
MRRTKRTIARPAEIDGVGLFTGNPVHLRLLPADPGNGIVFTRTDLPGQPSVPLTPETITPRFRRTAVAAEEFEVESIEHMLSALTGVGVDNIQIHVSAPEMPGLDGCSAPFVRILRECGLQNQQEEKRLLRLAQPVAYQEQDASIVALPSERGLTISYSLNYDDSFVGAQHLTLPITEETYASQIAPARTFCLESEVNAFREKGLGKGASYENTLVVGPSGVIRNTLRFPDEFVRHKILDLLGDLGALDGILACHIVAIRSGHTTNIKFVKKLHQTLYPEEGAGLTAPLLDVHELFKILPHRYPMLLIDKVLEMEGYHRAVGIKNVTVNEPYFAGHFPGRPILPGVLMIEAMAQLAGALLMRRAENQSKIAVLISLDNVKLRKTVVPGDQLRIEAEAIKIKARTGEVQARVTVEGQLAAEANMKFMLADKE